MIKDGKVLKIEVTYTNLYKASYILDNQEFTYTHFGEAMLEAIKNWKKSFKCPECNNTEFCIHTTQIMKDGEIIDFDSFNELNITQCSKCGLSGILKDFTC